MVFNDWDHLSFEIKVACQFGTQVDLKSLKGVLSIFLFQKRLLLLNLIKTMSELKKILTKNMGFIALVSVTLGLAPYSREPHIWGKIKWIQGGAIGMELMTVV